MGFGKDNKGAIVMQKVGQALGALAQGAGILIGTKPALTNDYRMLKSIGAAVADNMTAGEGQGLLLYLADGDLTLAEVEAKIEQTGPLGSSDRVEQEIAERYVRLIGAAGESLGTELSFHNMEGGDILVVKPRWTFGETKSWNYVVYNLGETLTTGGVVQTNWEHFGVWVN